MVPARMSGSWSPLRRRGDRLAWPLGDRKDGLSLA